MIFRENRDTGNTVGALIYAICLFGGVMFGIFEKLTSIGNIID